MPPRAGETRVSAGAAYGDWTRFACRCWPDARFLMIEPLIEFADALNVLARQCPNTRWINAAAGAEAGVQEIGIGRNLLTSSLAYPGQTQRAVPVVTIDNLMSDGSLQQPGLMKLDVQGYEIKVLEGAHTATAGCTAVMRELPFYRFAPGMSLVHESIAWMAARGFRPYEIVDTMRRPLDGAMGQCDILFVREAHALLSSNSWDGQ
jgi:FkbM family methyltransferase